MNLDNLNTEQQNAVTADFGPVCVLAGAGTGKTRVLTRRIAYLIDDLDIEPKKILAMTFTKKAAQEMQERISKIIDTSKSHPVITTIHAFCYQLLLNESDSLTLLRPGFGVADAFQMKLVIQEAIKKKRKPENWYANNCQAFRKYMLEQKQKKLLPEETPTDLYPEYRDMYFCVQEILTSKNLLSFDNMLFYVARLFDENESVKRRYQNRFDCVLVDEYQDTSPLQFEIIKTLTETTRNLYVVGDNDQAIYGFRGADMGIILSFKDTFPEAETFKLESNYRSTPNIISAANAVISNNIHRFDKKLIATSKARSKISYTEYLNKYDEAKDIADRIKKLKGETAIVVRNNCMTAAFEASLKQLNIPFVVYGEKSFFSREEVLDLIAYMEFILDDKNYDAFQRIANKPSRYIGNVTKTKVIEYCRRFNIGVLDMIKNGLDALGLNSFQKKSVASFYTKAKFVKSKNLKPDKLVDAILNDFDYMSYFDNVDNEEIKQDKISNVYAVKSLATHFMEGGSFGLKDFLSYFYYMQDNKEETPNAVKIMTIHKAKGLEFDNVFVVSANENFLPSKYALVAFENLKNDKLLEEERRLFYVAITRAKKNLFLSSYAEDEDRSYETSRFVKEIPEKLLKHSKSLSLEKQQVEIPDSFFCD